MTVSQLIAALKEQLSEAGDLDVYAYQDQPEIIGLIDGCEFNDDTTSIILVTFESGS